MACHNTEDPDVTTRKTQGALPFFFKDHRLETEAKHQNIN